MCVASTSRLGIAEATPRSKHVRFPGLTTTRNKFVEKGLALCSVRSPGYLGCR